MHQSRHLTDRLLHFRLASIFPSWIATPQVRSLHFPTLAEQRTHFRPTASAALLEEGRNEDYAKEEANSDLKVATGRLRLSRERRSPGWEGTLVERVKVWLKKIFTYPC